MTPETRGRFAVLVERQLAGLLSPTETGDLSEFLETSGEARQIYLRAVEFHLDLGSAFAAKVPALAPTEAISRSFREEKASTAPIVAGVESVGIPGNPPGVDVPGKRLRRWTLRLATIAVAAGFLWGGVILVIVINSGGSPSKDDFKDRESRTSAGAQALEKNALGPGHWKPPPAGVPVPGAAPPPLAGNDAGFPPEATLIDLPEALLKQLTDRLAAIPAGYRQLLPASDRTRIDRLLQKRKGGPEDMDFINTLLLGNALSRFEEEHATLRAKIAEIEHKIGQAVAFDVITRKNGSMLEGKIEAETEEYVKIRARLGSANVPRTDIQKIEKNKGSGLEFPEKVKAAQGRVDALSALLTWCKEKNLRLEKEYVGYLILLLEPTHEMARAAVGLGRPEIQREK